MTTLTTELTRALERLPEVQLAVLFGSHARGRATPASDIDVALELDPDTADSRRRIERLLQEVVGDRVEVVHVTDAPPLLRMEIARHGQVLVERRPNVWSRFKGRAMIDWGDWAPYARRLAAAAIRRNRERLKS